MFSLLFNKIYIQTVRNGKQIIRLLRMKLIEYTNFNSCVIGYCLSKKKKRRKTITKNIYFKRIISKIILTSYT